MLLAAYAGQMLGDVDGAQEQFAEIVETAEPLAPDSRRVALAECALMELDQGGGRRAESLVQEFWRSLREAGAEDYLTSFLGMVASARIAARRGDVRRSKEELSRVQLLRRLVSWAVPWLGVRCLTELARAHLSVSDVSCARASLAQARATIAHRPLLGTLVHAVDELDQLSEQTADTPADRAASRTDRELRLLPFLQTYLTLGEIGDRLGVSKNTIKTQTGSVYSKLGAGSRSEAVELAVSRGLLPPSTSSRCRRPRSEPRGDTAPDGRRSSPLEGDDIVDRAALHLGPSSPALHAPTLCTQGGIHVNWPTRARGAQVPRQPVQGRDHP